MESVRLNLISSGSTIRMMEMILQLEEKERLKAIVLLWYWWLERNRIREGERRRDPSVSAFSITRMTDEFLAIAAEGEKRHRVDRVKARWSRPPADTLKISSDGAYCAASGTGGWGYVIRDEEGSVICAAVLVQCALTISSTHCMLRRWDACRESEQQVRRGSAGR
jgi:hypothetical protein